MNIFVKAWKGEASLAVAFWIIYILFGIIVGFIITMIYATVDPNFNYYIDHNKIASIEFPYTLYAAICVWRCSRNSSVVWRVLARIVVVLGVIAGVLNILSLMQNPRGDIRPLATPSAPSAPSAPPASPVPPTPPANP